MTTLTYNAIAREMAETLIDQVIELKDDEACIRALHQMRFTPRQIKRHLDAARALARETRVITVEVLSHLMSDERDNDT